jgi:drug/metabolite transporter (DMT)-like permease
MGSPWSMAGRVRYVLRGSRGRMGSHARVSSAVLIAALCLFWALTFIAQRTALREAPPLWIGAGRTTIGALALSPALGRLTARGWRVSAGLALTNVVGFVGLQLIGLDAIGAGPAAAIIYTQPVLVALLGHLWLGERLSGTRALGALIGLAGVTLVSAHELSAVSPGAVAALLGSAVCWTAGTLLTRATPEQPVLRVVATQQALGAPVLLAAALIAEPAPAVTGRLAAMVLYAGLFGSAGGLLLFTTLLRRGEAAVMSAWMFLVPITAAVLGVVLLGEPLRLPLAIGLVLVSVGVRLATRAPGRSAGFEPSRVRPRVRAISGGRGK